MFNAFVDAVSGSSWSYGIVFAVSMLDAFLASFESLSNLSSASAGDSGSFLRICVRQFLILP